MILAGFHIGTQFSILKQLKLQITKTKQESGSNSMNKAADNLNKELEADDVKAMQRLSEAYKSVRNELGKVIVGQSDVIEQLMIAIFAQGHCLLEGVPGLAKTLMVSTLADTLQLSFNRIQFTPDLMPSDILGTEVIQDDKVTGAREFKFLKGPVFSNIILADEINRTPPKTQAALLEAMQEKQVTVGGVRNTLPAPFFVLATQNPVEQEGTYPLPEAQLDRFMFLIEVDYPSRAEEIQIARTTTGGKSPKLDKIISGEQVIEFQELVRRVPVPDHIYEFAVDLTRRSRPNSADAPDWLKPLVGWGAGPRAVQYLILGAKSRAALHGSYMVRLEDILEVAEPVLGHRVLTTFAAESEGMSSRDVVRRLVEDLSKEG